MRRLTPALCAVFIGVSLTAWADSGGPFQGQVFETTNSDGRLVVKRGLIQTTDGLTRRDSVEVLLVKDPSSPEQRLATLWSDAIVICELDPRRMYEVDPRVRDINGTLFDYYRDLYDEAQGLQLRTANDNDSRKLLLLELKRHMARYRSSLVLP